MRKILPAQAKQPRRARKEGGWKGAHTGLLQVAENEVVELRSREHPHGRMARAGAGEAVELETGSRRGREWPGPMRMRVF